MKDNWSDPEFTKDWDTDTHKGNPSRPFQLDLLTDIITDNHKENHKILDLGFGTGQVEQMIFSKLPRAEIVCVDSSEVMILQAKDRLSSFWNNITAIKHNLEDIENLKLPDPNYQFAITCQVLHEVPAERKKAIFKFIYERLIPGGMYFILDRFKVDAEALTPAYKSLWNWQERSAKLKSNKTFEKYKSQISSKDDSPDTLEDQLRWLREAGFNAGWLHLQLDRGLIVGVK